MGDFWDVSPAIGFFFFFIVYFFYSFFTLKPDSQVPGMLWIWGMCTKKKIPDWEIERVHLTTLISEIFLISSFVRKVAKFNSCEIYWR